MHCLSLPLPVARLLKRIFNVVSTLAISNQYMLAQKTEIDGGKETTVTQKARELERTHLMELLSSRFTDAGNSFSSSEYYIYCFISL